MNPTAESVVAPPRTDEPALADETTADLFDVARSRVWQAPTRIGTLVLCLPLLVLIAADHGGTLYALLSGAVVVLMVVVIGWEGGGMGVRALGWPKTAHGLLADLAWAPVPAMVLRARDTVVELADGTRLRVYGLPRPGRSVIAATGRVWLVGPSANGWYALRVDGLHSPWPARRVTGRAGDATPVAPPATDAPAADWLAIQMGQWRLEAVVAAVVAACGLMSVLLSGGRDFGLFFGALLIVGGLGVLAYTLPRLRQVLRVAAMVRAGPWYRAEARLVSSRKLQDGRADATVDVRLVTGERYTVTLSSVEADLPANIWKAESVWVAGVPAAGRQSVVGFPGYPVLGPALFAANHEEL